MGADAYGTRRQIASFSSLTSHRTLYTRTSVQNAGPKQTCFICLEATRKEARADARACYLLIVKKAKRNPDYLFMDQLRYNQETLKKKYLYYEIDYSPHKEKK